MAETKPKRKPGRKTPAQAKWLVDKINETDAKGKKTKTTAPPDTVVSTEIIPVKDTPLSPEKINSKLNKRQIEFCRQYVLNNFNGLQAYKIAYGVENADTAKSNAHKLLTNTYIDAKVDEFYREKILEGKRTKEWLMQELESIINLDMTLAMEYGVITVERRDGDDNSIVTEIPAMIVKDVTALPYSMRKWIEVMETTPEGYTKVKFISKTKILELFGLELGMFNKGNINIFADKMALTINKPGEVKVLNVNQK